MLKAADFTFFRLVRLPLIFDKATQNSLKVHLKYIFVFYPKFTAATADNIVQDLFRTKITTTTRLGDNK